MHPTEPKNAFLVMRGNGWSLGRISKQLRVPKSTLFHWESEPLIRRTINVFKALQLEKLQEKYIPSAEEELTRLSTCLARLENALDKHDFDRMRPEFLLRASLQVRSRLHKFRSDVQPCRTLDEGELRSNPLPGCISRSETSSLEAGENLSTLQKPGAVDGEAPCSASEKADDENGTISHENKSSSRSNHSEPAASNNQNGTTVPTSEAESPSPVVSILADAPPSNPASSASPQRQDNRHEPNRASNTNEPTSPGRERYGDLAVPLSTISAHREEIALAAGFQPHRSPPRLESRSLNETVNKA
jgi:hypothetical protein